MLKHFLSDESGATSIEYALIASLISIFVLAAIALVGHNVSNRYNNVATQVNNAMTQH